MPLIQRDLELVVFNKEQKNNGLLANSKYLDNDRCPGNEKEISVNSV